MRTSKEYRQHAKECLELANASTYVYVKTTLTELAEELDKTADRLEPKTVSHNKVKPRPFKLQAPSRHH
jgi:hypothetical protein